MLYFITHKIFVGICSLLITLYHSTSVNVNKIKDFGEAAKRELERQRQLEWERSRRQELLTQRNREQENIVLLKARKKTLEFELEALVH